MASFDLRMGFSPPVVDGVPVFKDGDSIAAYVDVHTNGVAEYHVLEVAILGRVVVGETIWHKVLDTKLYDRGVINGSKLFDFVFRDVDFSTFETYEPEDDAVGLTYFLRATLSPVRGKGIFIDQEIRVVNGIQSLGDTVPLMLHYNVSGLNVKVEIQQNRYSMTDTIHGVVHHDVSRKRFIRWAGRERLRIKLESQITDKVDYLIHKETVLAQVDMDLNTQMGARPFSFDLRNVADSPTYVAVYNNFSVRKYVTVLLGVGDAELELAEEEVGIFRLV